jgi:hypothetical protein
MGGERGAGEEEEKKRAGEKKSVLYIGKCNGSNELVAMYTRQDLCETYR